MDLQLIHELLHILDRCERSIVRGHAQPRSPSLFPSHFFHGQQDSPWFHRSCPSRRPLSTNTFRPIGGNISSTTKSWNEVRFGRIPSSKPQAAARLRAV